MRNKLLFALLLIIGPVILEGCCGDTYTYAVNPGEFQLRVYDDANLSSENTGSINAENFIIRFQFPDATVEKMAYNNKISLGSKAYAMTCYDEYVYIPSVSNITITTDRDYNAEYPAGSNLSDIFVGIKYVYQDSENDVPSPLAANYDNLAIFFSNYFAETYFHPEYDLESMPPFYVLKPAVMPEISGSFIFTVTVNFNNDASTTKVTTPVTLLL